MYNVYLLDGFLLTTTDDLQVAKGIIAVYGGKITSDDDEIIFEVE